MPLIYGNQAVNEALRSQNKVERLYVLSGHRNESGQLVAEARRQEVEVRVVDRKELDKICRDGRHQGIAAQVVHRRYGLDDLLAIAEERGEPPFLLVTDHLEDPHNLGAVIRTAEAAGFHGAIIPTRRAAPVTATVVRASAGATAHLPLVFVGNLSQAIARLKERGVWVVGLEGEAELSIYKADLKGPLALVIGAEGSGIGHAVAKSCDFLVNIPLLGKVESLNASVAFAVSAFEALRQRRNILESH